MRLLTVRHAPKLPLIDCELGSRMIALMGRKPRENRRATPERLGVLVGGALGLVVIGYGLMVLLFTF